MEYSGYAPEWDEVVFRGDPADGAFIAFWLRDGRVVAGMNVNVWDVNERVRALIRSGYWAPMAMGTGEAVAAAEAAVTDRLTSLEGVEGRVASGVPGEELAAFGGEVDLLVVGSRGYGPVRRLMLGSTSQHLAAPRARAIGPLSAARPATPRSCAQRG